MANEIVPRWEWRAFGDSFGGSENPFAGYEPSGTQESDEIYLLSPDSSENVKVRDGLLDIKKFQRANADGLEQWKPVLKHGFPLPMAAVMSMFNVLGVTSPTLARGDYTLQQLTDELVASVPGMRVVKVHKTRTRYTVDGCMSEIAQVAADGKATRTIALELEDAAKVIAAVRKLGLESYGNVSYPKGLKRLVGMTN
jgi:exopolyphosphatase/guanosine-5'-triphosphate,3'-diphosphate pyrophosphatase